MFMPLVMTLLVLNNDVGNETNMRVIATLPAILVDGQAQENATLSVSTEDDFRRFELRIGNHVTHGEFFGVDGNVPTMKVVQLGVRPTIQVIEVCWLANPSSTSCRYLHVDGSGFVELLTLTVDLNSSRPVIVKDGRVVAHSWMGFWARKDEYVLNHTRTALEKRPNTRYFLHTKGTVARSFALYGTPEAKSKVGKSKVGTELSIREWNPDTDRYLIYEEDRALGWTKILPEYFSDLPWSG